MLARPLPALQSVAMPRLNVRRQRTPLGALAIAIVVACSSPTDACGCSPIPPGVIVVGTVTDASGAPVVGAQLLLDGIPDTTTVEPPLADDGRTFTDETGEFTERVLSRNYLAGELILRAGVIEAGTTDTVRLRLGRARFRSGSPLDTLRVAISIP